MSLDTAIRGVPFRPANLLAAPLAPRWRRVLLFALLAATVLAGAALAIDVVHANGINAVELAMVAFFTINFAWIGLSFWTATFGFARLAAGRRRGDVDADDGTPLTARTAIVMPAFREDPARVFAGVEAIWHSLAATGEAHAFDVFVLSDTPEPEAGAVEERHWAALCHRLGAGARIHYRRRARNSGRKAGNIADFCESWGTAYDFMLVLDADSLMAGEAIVRLARLMQANPRAGIIQTAPLPVGRTTPFARAQQFACRLYGPVVATGAAWWHGSDGNYWGHNAIIRIAAFMASCRLPDLPGRAPLGGEILSHDFVEAALIRRAGWSVHLAPEIAASYEELPANIIDYAARDRRWCQGNLQHAKVLPAVGLHPMSRLHLASGIMAFVAAPLWLALLLLGMADVSMQALTTHEYFLPGYNLFPNWPESRSREIGLLLALTGALLLLPKVYGLVLATVDRATRAAFGGLTGLLRGAAAELIFSLLLAPVMMYCHSRFVAEILLGRSVGWATQARDERRVALRDAAARFTLPTLVGLAWSAALLTVAPEYFVWFLPALAGLVLSIPIAVAGGNAALGRAARRAGLCVTPEERGTPEMLYRLDKALRDAAAAPPGLAGAAPYAAPPAPAPAAMPVQSLAPFWRVARPARAAARHTAPQGV